MLGIVLFLSIDAAYVVGWWLVDGDGAACQSTHN